MSPSPFSRGHKTFLPAAMLASGALCLAAAAKGRVPSPTPPTYESIPLPILTTPPKHGDRHQRRGLQATGTLIDQEFRILVISALRAGSDAWNDRVAKWAEQLTESRPHLVLATGPFLGTPQALSSVQPILEPLLRYPGVFCLSGSDLSPTSPGSMLRAVMTEFGWHDATGHRVEFSQAGVNISVTGAPPAPASHVAPPSTSHVALPSASHVAPPSPGTDLSIGLSPELDEPTVNDFINLGYRLVVTGAPSTRGAATSRLLSTSPGRRVGRWIEQTVSPVADAAATLLPPETLDFGLNARGDATVYVSAGLRPLPVWRHWGQHTPRAAVLRLSCPVDG